MPSSTLETRCPKCGSAEVVYIAIMHDDLEVYRCAGCGVQFTVQRPPQRPRRPTLK